MNENGGPDFLLPKKLEKIFAALATQYAQQGNPLLQQILVNSRYQVHEGSTYDNWDGGTWAHTIDLQVPAPIFHEIFDKLDDVARKIRDDTNRLSNTPRESIEQVSLEVQDSPLLENWREQSGALIRPSVAAGVAPNGQLARLWTPGYLRLFLSHKAEYKKEASYFKHAMAYYGVSCFVAHEDIQPTKEWQDEIEIALSSMDALAALLTDKFHESYWTDQEVGVAIGRQVPVVPIRIGRTPYGFIGKYQAVAGTEKAPSVLAKEVYDLLWTMPSLKDRLAESLVARFEASANYDEANTLMKYLGKIEKAPPVLIERLEKVPQNNSQVAGAWDVQAKLRPLLKRLRGT